MGTVVYAGGFINDIMFKGISGNIYNYVDIKSMSKAWVDNVNTGISINANNEKKKSSVIALPNHYTPCLLYPKSVVTHIDFSTVTSEWGVQSYYIRMGVPVNVQDVNYFRYKYRINEVELISPEESLMYIKTLDDFCDKLKGITEIGTLLLIERGIGLLTNDSTIYAINTIMVLFESDKQREDFNKYIKRELCVELPVLKDKPLLFI